MSSLVPELPTSPELERAKKYRALQFARRLAKAAREDAITASIEADVLESNLAVLEAQYLAGQS